MEWSSASVRRWLQQNVSDPLVVVIRRGADPKTLALSGALGITLGIFPIYGVTALFCAFAIGVLGERCNAPTMMLANLVATPLELSLVVPFLRLGEHLVNGEHLELTKDSLWKAVTGQASWEVVGGLYHAFIGWLFAAPFITILLYHALRPVMKCAVRKYGPQLSEVEFSPFSPLLKDPSV